MWHMRINFLWNLRTSFGLGLLLEPIIFNILLLWYSQPVFRKLISFPERRLDIAQGHEAMRVGRETTMIGITVVLNLVVDILHED